MELKTLIQEHVDGERFTSQGISRFEPLIQQFIQGTRFEGRYMLNSPLRASILNIYFLKNDFEGVFAEVRNNCAYLKHDEYNVILCDINFLSDWRNTFPRGYFKGESDWHIIDKEKGKKKEKWKKHISEDVFEEVLERAEESQHFMLDNFFIQWLLGHEIGHAVLNHSPGHLLYMPDESLKGNRLSKAREIEADLFALNHIFDDDLTRTIFWMSISRLVAAWVYAETGKSGSEIANSDTVIKIIDISHTHPPLLLRVLNMVEVLLEKYPYIDNTGYFKRLRSRVSVINAFE